MVQLVIDNAENYQQQAKEYLYTAEKMADRPVEGEVLAGAGTHQETIQTFFNFIEYLVLNSDEKITIVSSTLILSSSWTLTRLSAGGGAH